MMNNTYPNKYKQIQIENKYNTKSKLGVFLKFTKYLRQLEEGWEYYLSYIEEKYETNIDEQHNNENLTSLEEDINKIILQLDPHPDKDSSEIIIYKYINDIRIYIKNKKEINKLKTYLNPKHRYDFSLDEDGLNYRIIDNIITLNKVMKEYKTLYEVDQQGYNTIYPVK